MYLNIQYSSLELSFYYFSVFHLYIFTSLYLFFFSTFFFPPPTPLLRYKLVVCMFSPVQGLRFGLGRTHRQANGQVSHADPSHASGTSCLTCPLYICHSFTLFLPPERKPGIRDAGTAESRKGIFKVVAEAFPYSNLLGLFAFRYTCNSPSTGAA